MTPASLVPTKDGIIYLFICSQSSIPWWPSSLSWINTALVFPFLFLIYDFFYCVLHTVLHFRSIYGWIHKHHHRQHSPTRGYIDAANVHPIEFVLGEWLYMFVVALLSPWCVCVCVCPARLDCLFV